jgi:PKD repeat protein
MHYCTSKLLLLAFALLILVSMTPANAAPTQSLRSGGYFCGTDGTCQWFKPDDPDWLFERFTFAMGYADCAADIQTWRAKSPGSILTLYTTGTDMPAYKSYTSNSYLFGRKSTYVRDRMVELGDIEENAYMHFYEDTKIINWNGSGYDTVLIPGTYSMTITDADSASRVINSYVNYLFHSGVTYNSDARLSPNFTNSNLRQAYKEFITQAFNEQMTEHWPVATGTWDGLYFDNYSPYSMSGGGLVSGGHVVETGTDPSNLLVLATDPYAAWCWEWMKTFGREVRDTLHQADQWAVDGRKKFLCYNVGLSFRDEYLDPELSGADALNFEFAFDPVYSNNESYYRLENIHSRDSIATANGVTFFWCSRPRTSYGNGYTNKQQAIYDNLCFYYVARTDSTWIFMRPEPGNAYGVFLNPGFDTLAWIPAMEYDLGRPLGHYQLAASGASPDQGGATYKIWVRDYEYGRVFMRPRDGFDAAWGDLSTPVQVDAGGSFRVLRADGTIGPTVTSVSLNGAEGVILVSEGNADFAATPQTGYQPLTVSFSGQSAAAVSSWHWDFGDGTTSSEQNPQHTYDAAGSYTVRMIAYTDAGTETVEKTDYITVTERPQARFTATPTSGSGPLEVHFLDQSTGNPTSWHWDFGDGATCSECSPTHIYGSPGDYSVTLTVSDSVVDDDTTAVDLIEVQQVSNDAVRIFAESDMPLFGVVSGDCGNTTTSDDLYEVLKEVLLTERHNKTRSCLDHRWLFDVPPSGSVSFVVEAFRPVNSENDNFDFEYSLDNVNFLPICTVASDAERIYRMELPDHVCGSVIVRVTDTDRSWKSSECDSLYVDYMCFEVSGTPSPPDSLFVSGIEIQRTGGKAGKYRAVASVVVGSFSGAVTSMATVWGQFHCITEEAVSSLVGGDGTAILTSSSVRRPQGEWCLTVDSVTSALDVYVPTANVTSSACENSITKQSDLPQALELGQNYPNPFNPVTSITFTLPTPSEVHLEVYNISGQKVAVLAEGYYDAGLHQVQWDAADPKSGIAASGIYFYRLTTGELSASRKMLLMK